MGSTFSTCSLIPAHLQFTLNAEIRVISNAPNILLRDYFMQCSLNNLGWPKKFIWLRNTLFEKGLSGNEKRSLLVLLKTE